METVTRSNSGNSGTLSRIQTKPENGGWFDGECKTVVVKKSIYSI
jgi:hypothetical protein